MDQLADYPEIVKRVISDYAAYKPSYGEVEVETVFDEARGHYEMVHIGWNGWRRIHGSIIHVDLRDGKIWIQRDGTEDGIANDLVRAGIPHDRIVLAFQHPTERPYSDFAVG